MLISERIKLSSLNFKIICRKSEKVAGKSPQKIKKWTTDT